MRRPATAEARTCRSIRVAVAPPAALTGGNTRGCRPITLQLSATWTSRFSKDFPFRDRWIVQFRAEAFNFADTPQYGTPGNNRQDSTFGQVTSTASGSERHIQFALRIQF